MHVIKTSGSESRGQEEAVCTRISDLRDHYSELFAQMDGLNFLNAVAQPLLQLSLSLLQAWYFLPSETKR